MDRMPIPRTYERRTIYAVWPVPQSVLWNGPGIEGATALLTDECEQVGAEIVLESIELGTDVFARRLLVGEWWATADAFVGVALEDRAAVRRVIQSRPSSTAIRVFPPEPVQHL